jgi:hypothetical protein
VDRDDDILTRDQIDLATDEVGGPRVVDVERFDGQMDARLGSNEPGLPGVSSLTLDLADLEPEQAVDGRDDVSRAFGVAVQVDPEESPLPERLEDVRGDLDPAVVPVRIEQPRRRGCQWTRLRSPAASAAMIATAYWIASMDTSSLGSWSTGVQSRSGERGVSGNAVCVVIADRIVSSRAMRSDAPGSGSHHARITTPNAASPRVTPRTDCEPPATEWTHRGRTTDACRPIGSSASPVDGARHRVVRIPGGFHDQASPVDLGDGRGVGRVLAVW